MKANQNTETNYKSTFSIHLGFGFYIVRSQKSDGKFINKRGHSFMENYFGESLKANPVHEMINRRMGFEDGYMNCLRDLKIKLRYTKNK